MVVAHDLKDVMLKSSPEMLAPGLVPEGGKIDVFGWMTKGMTPEFIRMTYENSLYRMYTLLGMQNGAKDVQAIASLSAYGLGNKRTLDQLIAFTGIDTRSKTVVGCRCKALEWVPFTPDSDPRVIEGDIWGYGPELSYRGEANIPLLNKDIEIYRNGFIEVQGSDMNKIHENPQDYIPDSDTGELWAIFQYVDMMVDNFIDSVDSSLDGTDDKFHHGHGHRVLKLILLGAPAFVLVIIAAITISKPEIHPDIHLDD